MPKDATVLYYEILRKFKVYEQKRRPRRVQKKEKLPEKEILKHFKKSKNKRPNEILMKLKATLDWNSTRNLVLDGRLILSSNIT